MSKKRRKPAARTAHQQRTKRRANTPTLTLSVEEFEKRRHELIGQSVIVAATPVAVTPPTKQCGTATGLVPLSPEEIDTIRLARTNPMAARKLRVSEWGKVFGDDSHNGPGKKLKKLQAAGCAERINNITWEVRLDALSLPEKVRLQRLFQN